MFLKVEKDGKIFYFNIVKIVACIVEGTNVTLFMEGDKPFKFEADPDALYILDIILNATDITQIPETEIPQVNPSLAETIEFERNETEENLSDVDIEGE